MKEFIVAWNPTVVDKLNEEIPKHLSDITFEKVPRKLTVSTMNGSYEIDGQAEVKIMVNDRTKNYFKHKLKFGDTLDENFPRALQIYIQDELKIKVL